ncbi:hypothetical protein TNCV_630421 [Trichonephila clavipes]|nr:hypothetical protein TNCV_630421 [Trichonephila clavipes]
MGWLISNAGITPSANKKRITTLLSSLVEMNNGAVILNGLLHSHDYDKRQEACCIEVLPTTFHSALDTSTVATPWKEKLQNSF